jgi:hypothetical protein
LLNALIFKRFLIKPRDDILFYAAKNNKSSLKRVIFRGVEISPLKRSQRDEKNSDSDIYTG